MSSKLWNKYWGSVERKEFTITADYSRKKEREILLKFKKKDGMKIAEVGSGSAFGSLCFAEGKNKVYAIDFSEKALSRANLIYIGNKKIKNLISVLADIRKLPFDNGFFDVVWNQGVLEHFEDPSIIVNEMIRVTKKGGFIIVFVPNKNSWEYLYYKMAEIFKFLPWPFGTQDFYNYKEVADFFDKTKGKIIKITGVVPFLFPIPIRNRMIKKVLKKFVFNLFEKIENRFNDKIKARFGRQVCIIFNKK